jgi:integrase
LNKFRWREWTPALRAAGIPHRRIYDTRHTFCSWALRDGVSLFLLSRIMGTSIALLDSTYGHLVPDSEEHIRGLLEAGDRQRLGHVRATEADL